MEDNSKMKEVTEILKDFAKVVKEKNNLGEAASYIMSSEDFVAFMFAVRGSVSNFKGEEMEAQLYGNLSCLVVGYHLGINKQKEVN